MVAGYSNKVLNIGFLVIYRYIRLQFFSVYFYELKYFGVD